MNRGHDLADGLTVLPQMVRAVTPDAVLLRVLDRYLVVYGGRGKADGSVVVTVHDERHGIDAGAELLAGESTPLPWIKFGGFGRPDTPAAGLLVTFTGWQVAAGGVATFMVSRASPNLAALLDRAVGGVGGSVDATPDPDQPATIKMKTAAVQAKAARKARPPRIHLDGTQRDFIRLALGMMAARAAANPDDAKRMVMDVGWDTRGPLGALVVKEVADLLVVIPPNGFKVDPDVLPPQVPDPQS